MDLTKIMDFVRIQTPTGSGEDIKGVIKFTPHSATPLVAFQDVGPFIFTNGDNWKTLTAEFVGIAKNLSKLVRVLSSNTNLKTSGLSSATNAIR